MPEGQLVIADNVEWKERVEIITDIVWIASVGVDEIR